MRECKDCRGEILSGKMMECASCGATFCKDCSTKTKNICPYCYGNLEFKG